MSELIWHYTPISTLEYLHREPELCATSYQFCNDSEELIDGLKTVIEHNSKDKLELYKELIERYYIFIACFSASKDNLSQWRSYTQNGGCALGFSREKIIKKLNNGDNSHQLLEEKPLYYVSGQENMWLAIWGKCIYNKNDKERFFENISQYSQIINEHNPGQDCSDIVNLLFLPFSKNSSFAIEDEERLVYLKVKKDSDDILLFGGKPRIKTFIKCNSEFMEEIMISPHGNKERNKYIAKLFSKGIKVTESDSTYNGY